MITASRNMVYVSWIRTHLQYGTNTRDEDQTRNKFKRYQNFYCLDMEVGITRKILEDDKRYFHREHLQCNRDLLKKMFKKN